MLTADLVLCRRRGGELKLTKLDAKKRARALALAEAFHGLAVSHVGQRRDELLEAWSAVNVGPREKKLADGIRKLIDDGLTFEVGGDGDPVALRKAVFEEATARRKALPEEERFDREAFIAEMAEAHGMDVETLERGLYGDLKGAQLLASCEAAPPARLVDGYELKMAQAVLLRAVHVTAKIRGAEPAAARALFRKLKFLRLLYRVEKEKDGALRIEIDGPFSLFGSVTKYGLQLALALPALTACGKWELNAELRWGKDRRPLAFALAGDARRTERPDEALPDEVQALLEKFAKRKSGWRAEVADQVLDLPGVGLCVPDLRFVRGDDEVYLEVMGFWSRDAVWRRVELVQAGLAERILFAVSKRLRVSEAVLDDDLPGALVVYKGALSPKVIEDKLEALTKR